MAWCTAALKCRIIPNCDDSISKTLWTDKGWLNQHLVQEELYDLMFDPNETNNLIDNSSLTETVDDLRGRMGKWMRETNDPALDGTPGRYCPDTCVINEQDSFSPRSDALINLTPESRKHNELL
jgi:N-sulfoglucosamine sulfohydrolase